MIAFWSCCGTSVDVPTAVVGVYVLPGHCPKCSEPMYKWDVLMDSPTGAPEQVFLKAAKRSIFKETNA